MQRTRNETRSTSSSTSSSAIGTASRLSAYAAAATGAMLASSSADAAVTIVNISQETASTDFTIDLSEAGEGNSNFTFSNIGLTNFAYGRISAVNQLDNFQFVATALVGSSVFLDENDAWNNTTQAFNFPTSGNTGYLGFRLTVGEGASRYGWIEYVNDGTSTTVSRWAYESSGGGITTPGASAVPGGAGLAALAFGAAGIRGRRRQHC